MGEGKKGRRGWGSDRADNVNVTQQDTLQQYPTSTQHSIRCWEWGEFILRHAYVESGASTAPGPLRPNMNTVQ